MKSGEKGETRKSITPLEKNKIYIVEGRLLGEKCLYFTTFIKNKSNCLVKIIG